MAVELWEHLKNDAHHVHRTTYYVPWTGYQLQKCNKTANINVKKTVVYTRVNGAWMTHLKLQKLQKGDITQQHIDT